MSGHADLLKCLLPPASYTPDGPRVALSLGVEGAELDRTLTRCQQAMGALRPFAYQGWIEDWERIYKLPNECATDAVYYERLAMLALALRERCGITTQWLVSIAALFGYEITITEHTPAGEEDLDSYTFTVHAAGEITTLFRAGQSCAGDPLASWGAGPLECLINKYKPAHTQAFYAYA